MGLAAAAHRRWSPSWSRSPCCPPCSASPATGCSPALGARQLPPPTREADRSRLNDGVRWAAPGRELRVPVDPGGVVLGSARSRCPPPTCTSPSPSDSTAAVRHHPAPGLRPGRRGLRPRLQRPAPHGRRTATTRRRPTDGASPTQVAAWAATQDVVAVDAQVGPAPTGGTARWSRVIPAAGPDGRRPPRTCVRDLRDGSRADRARRPAPTSASPALTAIGIDVSDRLSGALPIYLAGRRRAGVPAADDRLPLDAGAAQGHRWASCSRSLATFGATVAVFQ